MISKIRFKEKVGTVCLADVEGGQMRWDMIVSEEEGILFNADSWINRRKWETIGNRLTIWWFLGMIRSEGQRRQSRDLIICISNHMHAKD